MTCLGIEHFANRVGFVFRLAWDEIAGVVQHDGFSAMLSDDGKAAVFVQARDGDFPRRECVIANPKDGKAGAFLVDAAFAAVEYESVGVEVLPR